MRTVQHSSVAFSVQEFLPEPQCKALIQLAEQEGFAPAGVRTAAGQKSMPMVRNNDRVMVESAYWVNELWQRLNTLELPVLNNQIAHGLPRQLRFYKYAAGQRFKMHKDGAWTEDGLTSQLTFLIYLNDSFVGGDTDFRDFRVVPKQGDALLFVHDTWHEGAAVESGVKYVLRSDVLYRSTDGATPGG